MRRDAGGAHGFQHVPGDDGILLQVAARMVRAEAHVGIGREVEDEIRASHGVLDGIQFQQVALDQAEARIGLRALQKAQKSGGQIVEAGDVVAVCQQAVHQIAADESRRSRNECSHFKLPPNRCSSPIRKMSRTLRRLPLTRLSRLSASSRQRIGNCSIR